MVGVVIHHLLHRFCFFSTAGPFAKLATRYLEGLGIPGHILLAIGRERKSSLVHLLLENNAALYRTKALQTPK